MKIEDYTLKRFRKWNKAKEFVNNNLNGWAFRGQANRNWTLETSIERIAKLYEQDKAKENYESRIFNEFIKVGRNHIEQFPDENDIIECFSLLQHYGSCTRFLDFTKSFYIAAFFAYEHILKEKNNISTPAIWAINYSKIIRKMRSRSGLPNLFPSKGMDEFNKPLEKLLFSIIEEGVSGNYQVNNNVQKSKFDRGIFCIEPKRLIDRMEIQQGIFLVPSNFEYNFVDNLINSFDEEDIKQNIVKIEISGSLEIRKEILLDLKKMNISTKTLFPGIEGLMKNLKYNFLQKWDDLDDCYIREIFT